MPELFNPFGPLQDSIRMMIPLVINERNAQAEAAQRQQHLDMLKQRYEQETLRDAEKVKQERQATTDKMKAQALLGAFETGIKNQDASLLKALAPQMEQVLGADLSGYAPTPKEDYGLHETAQGLMYVPKVPGRGQIQPAGGLQPPPQKWQVYPPQPRESAGQPDRMQKINDSLLKKGYRYNEETGEMEKVAGGPADKPEQTPRGYERDKEGNLKPLPEPLKAMPASMREDLTSIDELTYAIDEAEKLYTANNKQGKKWVGLMDSRIGAFTGATGIKADPNEQRFRALNQKIFNIIGKLRAGSAWTAPEIARLQQELQSISDSEVSFEEKTALTKEMLGKKREFILENATGYQRPAERAAPGGAQDYEAVKSKFGVK
jgi:hypothetical protein